ncbi:MAG: AI-2E family transporter [Oscillospiraceae bacterium]|nr:AI-2E family transporter [Oscillospiraceae bacterium]
MKQVKHPYIRLMLAFFGAAALSISFYFILSNAASIGAGLNVLKGVLAPFIIGAVIAYLLKPVCNFFERKLSDLRRNKGKAPGKGVEALSIVLSLVSALAVICILLVLVLPTLVESIQSLLLQIPDALQRLTNWLLQLAGNNETLYNYITNLSESAAQSIPEWLTDTLLPALETLIGSVFTGVSSVITLAKNILVGVIAAVYILGNRKRFAVQAKKLSYSVLGGKWSRRLTNEVRYADRVFGGFITGRVIDSLIIGLICFAGTLIFRMPYGVLVSVIVGVTNIIPFFGPFIGGIPSFLLILMTAPAKAVIFLIFIVVLQQFDGNFLGPKILGNVTGLSGFWVLFSIMVFGGLFGFPGMLLGVPVFAVIYDIIRKLVNKGVARRSAKEAPAETVVCENNEIEGEKP